VWKPLLKATKLPHHKPHAMRHSYATWSLEEGADIRYVQQALGHASIQETVDTYGHLVPERHEPRVALLYEYLVTDAARVRRVPLRPARRISPGQLREKSNGGG
jgi:integrase